MKGKYNTVIHVLFWCLVAVLVFIAAATVLTQNGQMGPLFIRTETEVVVEKEPVFVTRVEEIKEETEWFYFVATGYSANDPGQGTGNITATGKEIKTGMVAVDSKIIPLGTKIEIKDMGIFIAEDTGGKIKGNRIDIYFKTREEAESFGRQAIWVRVLNSDIRLAELLAR
jgi:3D (Asp-Asp-Asp) domain-containing protein